MILILTDANDKSTWDVVDWIEHLRLNYFVVNTNKINSISINYSEDISFTYNQRKIFFKDISSVWYRRGSISFFDTRNRTQIANFDDNLTKYLNRENQSLASYFYHLLGKKKSINKFYNSSLNKLQVLGLAQNMGLMIPPTLVTTSKNELQQFKDEHQEIIMKPISEVLTFMDVESNLRAISLTKQVNEEDISSLSDFYYPMKFQKLIKKKCDLRIFMLESKFYSMAILSQKNSKTETDFRNYDAINPNRKVSFKLPIQIEEKLLKLCSYLNLNCGSIDLILSEDNKFYFLEINPVGQFGMTSYPCNYYLEKRVAQYFLKYQR